MVVVVGHVVVALLPCRLGLSPVQWTVGDNLGESIMRTIKGFKQGKANGAAVLTEAEVRVIRKMAREEGMSAPELARIYRVSAETIRRILRGETWNWLDEEPRERALPDYEVPIPDSPELRESAAVSLEKFKAKMAQGQTPVYNIPLSSQEDEEREKRVAERMKQELEKHQAPDRMLDELLNPPKNQD